MRTVAPTADTFLPRDPQEGPHAPVAARRAVEFVAATDDTTLTLLNVQPPAEGPDAETTATERDEEAITELVERAGIEHLTYQTEVVVTEATRQTIVDAAGTFDTICIGATRSNGVTQAVFGSLTEAVGEEVERTVVIARGPEESPMSIREALTRRLEG